MTARVEEPGTHLEGPPTTAHRPGLSPLTRTVMPLVLYVAGMGVVVRIATLPPANPDTFLHLRIGRELLSGAWSIPHPGSPTSTGTADWVPTQWLAQVVMAWVEGAGGLSAVAWFGGLQLVLLVVVLLTAARVRADLLLAVPITAVAMVASLSGLSTRPQVMSYALAALTTALWLRAGERRQVPWVLVPLTWFWTTWHGMWPVGIALGVVACVGLAADRRVRGKVLAAMWAVPALCLVAALVTPVGPRVVSGVLTVTGRSAYFGEWGPTTFTEANGAAFLVMIGAAVIVMSRHRPTWTTILLVLTAGGAAAYSERTLPVAAAVLTPVLAGLLQQARSTPPDRAGRVEKVVVAGGAVGALLVTALLVPHTAQRPLRDIDPVLAVLDAEPAGTAVISDMGLGGRLLWEEPRLDVRVHGYVDVFTDAELADIITMRDGLPGWEEAVRRSGSTLAVVQDESFLGYNLESSGWSEVAAGDDAHLLVAPPGW